MATGCPLPARRSRWSGIVLGRACTDGMVACGMMQDDAHRLVCARTDNNKHIHMKSGYAPPAARYALPAPCSPLSAGRHRPRKRTRGRGAYMGTDVHRRTRTPHEDRLRAARSLFAVVSGAASA
ncbi:hypothetical protein B0H14DRAFT_3439046 [Mycena olivaceomarginata]|nr:hypothetical protein B0H14DRAFT_3439046 [Mycena olivaceomarginata]